MRYILVFLAGLIGSATIATAQSETGVFRDYETYSQFVDQHMLQRDFAPLILGLSVGDEFTSEEIETTRQTMEAAWPTDFEESTVFRREDLGGGVSHEGRIFWNGQFYAFYYALLHQRADDVLVINYLINSSIKPIMERF